MWRAGKGRFNQDAGFVGAALALGGLGLAGVLLLFVVPREDLAIGVLVGLFAGGPGVIVLLARLIRPGMSGCGCVACGSSGPTSPVRYLQNTGLLVALRMREVGGYACRGCSLRLFLRTTLHSAVLGWWGVLSFFLTPGFILNNVLFLARSQILARRQGEPGPPDGG